MTDLFCNWNFGPVNLPHLFHSSLHGPPLWQPQSIHVSHNFENVSVQHLSDPFRDGDNHPIMEVKRVYLFPQKMTFTSALAFLWREEGCRDLEWFTILLYREEAEGWYICEGKECSWSFLGFCLFQDREEAGGWYCSTESEQNCSTEIFILSQEQRGVQNRPYWDSNPGSPVYKTGALTN